MTKLLHSHFEIAPCSHNLILFQSQLCKLLPTNSIHPHPFFLHSLLQNIAVLPPAFTNDNKNIYCRSIEEEQTKIQDVQNSQAENIRYVHEEHKCFARRLIGRWDRESARRLADGVTGRELEMSDVNKTCLRHQTGLCWYKTMGSGKKCIGIFNSAHLSSALVLNESVEGQIIFHHS